MKVGGRALVAALVVVVLCGSVRLNRTGSVPLGFYWAMSAGESAVKGQLVVVCRQDAAWARWWGGEGGRCGGYEPLAKRVAGVGGDRVCVERGEGRCAVTVNGQVLGKAVPLGQCRSKGCEVLREGEVWLVGDARQSVDSRAFGAVEAGDLEAQLVPLLTER